MARELRREIDLRTVSGMTRSQWLFSMAPVSQPGYPPPPPRFGVGRKARSRGHVHPRSPLYGGWGGGRGGGGSPNKPFLTR